MQRGKFLTAHHDAPVAGKQNYLVFRTAELRAHGGRQTKAHGPQTAAGEEMPRQIHIVELGRPHLVLPYVSHDDRVFVRVFQYGFI